MPDMLGPLRPADVLDILIVSTLVYTLVAFLRRTRASFVAVGLGILAMLYVVARALDMQLTAAILGGFFAIVVVMVVVIFQEELRQLFEGLALWGLRRGRRDAGSSADPTDVLVACLYECARDRVGALVVVPGRQPLARQLQGGVELDGRISFPLLRSLFDPHSPGHDGAVVVEDGRVTRFSVHLPLSHDFSQLSGLGTRHSAALGLAERTDALCLVVSEERGTISLARQGRLERVTDPGRVSEAIAAVRRERTPVVRGSGRLAAAWRSGWSEKLAVLALVTGMWFLVVPGGRESSMTVPVRVEVSNLPNDWEVESIDPPRVQVTLEGVRRDFYFFDPKRLVLMVDAGLAAVGRRTFMVTSDDVLYRPRGLAVQGLEPNKVRLSLKAATS